LTIYIARLLTPEAYGLIAIATIAISLVQVLLSGGFTQGLIQEQGNTKEIYKSADFVFSLNLILSVILFVAIVILSPEIARFFHNSEAKIVVSILSFGLVINAFGDVQLAMLQKGMDFKSIFFRQLVPVLSQLIIVLPLAWLGFRVWALVAGALGSQLLAAIILWVKSDWKPKINLNYKEHKDLIRFGLFVIVESLTGWIVVQSDNLIVGRFLSTQDLGLYKTGFDLDNKIFLLLISSLVPVIYSQLCLLEDKGKKSELYLKIKTYIGIVVFPTMAGLILISGYFDNLLLGEKWKGISFIIAMLAINPGISYLWSIFPSYMRSIGKPQISTLITIISAIIGIPVYLIFVKYGLTTFVISRVSFGIVGVILFTFFETRELKISIKASLKPYYKPFLSALIMFIVGFGLQEMIFQTYTVISLILLITISAIIYGFMSFILSKKDLIRMMNMILKK